MKGHGLTATQTIHKAKRAPEREANRRLRDRARAGYRHDEIPGLLHWLDISGDSA
jgi:hypothetical protein